MEKPTSRREGGSQAMWQRGILGGMVSKADVHEIHAAPSLRLLIRQKTLVPIEDVEDLEVGPGTLITFAN